MSFHQVNIQADMAPLFVIFYIAVLAGTASGYRTVRSNCDVSCMNNVRILQSALVTNPGELHRLFDGGQFALHCTTRANVSACFYAVPECYGEMNVEGVVELIDYMCSKKLEFESNVSCFMDDESSRRIQTCYSEASDYCAIPTCVRNKLSSVPGCTDDAAEIAYNVGMINMIGCVRI